MLIDKDDLIRFLLERYYKIKLRCGDNEEEYKRGYIKGIIDTIEEVNKFQGFDK